MVSILFTHVKQIKVYVRARVKITRQWKSTLITEAKHAIAYYSVDAAGCDELLFQFHITSWC